MFHWHRGEACRSSPGKRPVWLILYHTLHCSSFFSGNLAQGWASLLVTWHSLKYSDLMCENLLWFNTGQLHSRQEKGLERPTSSPSKDWPQKRDQMSSTQTSLWEFQGGEVDQKVYCKVKNEIKLLPQIKFPYDELAWRWDGCSSKSSWFNMESTKQCEAVGHFQGGVTIFHILAWFTFPDIIIF